MRTWLVLVAGIAATLVAGAAHAQTAEDTNYAVKAQRRSDFTIGTSGGFGFGKASGYPNEIDKIDEPAFKSSTKLALGSGGLTWLGVAFNDYLSFGLGMGGMSLSGNDREASAGIFAFHVDSYPLFGVHESLRDLGLFGNFGAGPLTIKGGDEDADGGLLGYVEGGAVYERLRLWRFAFGPSVSVIHMWSQSAKLTGALVGGRVVFYGGP